MVKKWKRFSFLAKEEPIEVDDSSTDTADEGPVESYKYKFADSGKDIFTLFLNNFVLKS